MATTRFVIDTGNISLDGEFEGIVQSARVCNQDEESKYGFTFESVDGEIEVNIILSSMELDHLLSVIKQMKSSTTQKTLV